MRSLQVDSFRSSLVGLGVAMILLAGWLVWFFMAQVSLYELNQAAQITGQGLVIVNFPSETQGRFWPGQTARLRLDGDLGAEIGLIPAMVMDVTNQPRQKQIQVELATLFNAPLPDGLTGQVEIEVERISPAVLVMRATGQLLNNPWRSSGSSNGVNSN
jgi:hypothetical protein